MITQQEQTAGQEPGLIFGNPNYGDYERAKNKARCLLQQVLTKTEWEEYEAKGIIRLEGKRGIYIILPYCQTQIRSPSSGKCTAYACLQLSIPAPTYDRMIAEYLLIKNNEEKYWKTANIFSRSENEFGIATLFLITFDITLFANLLLEILTTR